MLPQPRPWNNRFSRPFLFSNPNAEQSSFQSDQSRELSLSEIDELSSPQHSRLRPSRQKSVPARFLEAVAHDSLDEVNLDITSEFLNIIASY